MNVVIGGYLVLWGPFCLSVAAIDGNWPPAGLDL